jgi:uncharacterized protein YcbK (DUF882 family)
MDRNIQITPNFKLSEFIRPQDELPEDWVLDNIYHLAHRLQVVRDILNKPIKITSGYRTPAHNKAVGGSPKSQHITGNAVDIVVSGMTPKQVQTALKNWSGGMGLGTTFTHLDTRPTKTRWSY